MGEDEGEELEDEGEGADVAEGDGEVHEAAVEGGAWQEGLGMGWLSAGR